MVPQEKRLVSMMEAVGLRVLEAGEKKVKESTSGTALVRPEKIGYIRRLVASLYEFIAEMDSRVQFRDKKRNFEWKLDQARKRVVLDPADPSIPYIDYCRFWITTDKKDPKRKLLNVDISLPDPDDPKTTTKVKAVPHALFDGAGGTLPYVTTEILTQKGEDGKDMMVVEYHLKSMLSITLRPNNPRDPFRVVPFGLAAPGMLETWRQVAAEYRERGASKDEWPDIETLPNNLRLRQGMQLLLWKPIYLAENPEGGYIYGEIYGRKIVSDGDNDLATPDQDPETGEWKFLHKYYFVITGMNDAQVQVKCLGKEGKVDLRSGKFNVGGTGRLDGFTVLGVDPITANFTTLMGHALRLASDASLDVTNPLYSYAFSIGEINPEDSEQAMRVILRPIAETAAFMVRGELKIKLESLVNELVVIQGLPSVEEVLAGKELDEVWFRKDGEDVLTSWIDSKIEVAFSWKSWLLRNIRQEVLRAILAKDGLTPPEKKQRVKSAEAVKVEEVALVASTEAPAVAEPVEATPPAVEAASEVPPTQAVEAPTAQAGGRRRKKVTETKETAEGQA